MSAEGVRIASDILNRMQLARCELLKLATHNLPLNPASEQDFLLGQMLEHGKDAMKHEFCKATSIEGAAI